jgi:PIN domain nuclease of toxin-antitoxin system
VKVLLNTHALIWHYLDDPQQSPLAKTTINSPANRLFVSPPVIGKSPSS